MRLAVVLSAAFALTCFVTPSCAPVKQHSRIVGNVVHRAGLVDSTWAVWEYYGHADLPPMVSLIEPPYLDCADGKAFQWPVIGCVYGVTTSPWTVSVAYTGTKWSETSLAHELLHAHEWTTGVVDLKHIGPNWQPGGMVDKARNMLVQRGL